MSTQRDREIADAMGYKKNKPFVTFFDHALEDRELSEKSGRPRFKACVFIRKIPSAPDLLVRDVFDRQMVEEDKKDWPEEWAAYCARRDEIRRGVPPVTAIPGMDVASIAELKALGVFNCEQFVNYPEPLDNMEGLRKLAKRILEVASEDRKERDDVRASTGGQVHANGSSVRTGPVRVSQIQTPQGETFRYETSFQV